MNQRRIRTESMFGRVAIGLLAIALFMRLLVPTGWMPAAGQGYAIILCTDMGAATAWVDEGGKVRKDSPNPGGTADNHCAFAGFSSAVTAPEPIGAIVPSPAFADASTGAAFSAVAIGHGLAAPPPPPTGPPTANL